MAFLDQNLCQHLLTKAGLSLIAHGQPIIEQRLNNLAESYHLKSSEDMIHLSNKDSLFEKKLLSSVTIHETLWFRDSHPFRNIFPVLQGKHNTNGKIKVWCGACSTGQEAYSLKMIQLMNFPSLNLDIFASDICQSSIDQAKSGTYDSFSMSRGIEASTRERFFSSQGNQWKIFPQVQQGIRFSTLNLKDRFESLPTFDLILLRNVIIYFPMEFKKELIHRLVEKLQPGGILLLGGCESIVGISPHLKLRSLDKTLYYEKTLS